MSELNGGPKVYYWGRLWNAPFTDDAELMHPSTLDGSRACDMCGELVRDTDDVVELPHMLGHLECHLRVVLGDVAHLEGRCLCVRGAGNEVVYPSDIYETYRDEARATLQWLVDHGRGSFR